MTISFSNFDGFEKPKNPVNESADAEFKAGDFAAVFNVTAFVPPVGAPIKTAAPQDSDEVTVAVQPIESNQNAFTKDNQIQSFLLQNSIDSPPQSLISPSREILPAAKFTRPHLTSENSPQSNVAVEALSGGLQAKKDANFQISVNPQNIIADGELPAGEKINSIRSSAENTEKNLFVPEIIQAKNLIGAAALTDKESNLIEAGDSEMTDASKTKFGFQAFEPSRNPFESDSQIQPLISPESGAQQPNSIQPNNKVLSDMEFTKSTLAQEIYNEISSARKDVGLQIFADDRSFADGEPATNPPLELVASINEENFLSRIQELNAGIRRISLEPARAEKSSDTTKLFSNFSTAVKADSSAEINLAPEFGTEKEIAAPIRQSVFGESGQSLNQSETELPKAEMQFEIQTNPGGQIFNNLLKSVTAELKIAETVMPIDNLNGKVFEQIEPRIFEAAAMVQGSDEKRILKMRLNPAELGAVEITLEKNAAGEISAHFQTENETTQQILGESLAQLRNSLENSGWQVGILETSCYSSSSNGGERRENQSEQFGAAENQFVGTAGFDGNSNTDDDSQSRLVNLRA